MKRGPLGRFLVRWFVSGLGLWIAAGILGSDKISLEGRIGAIIVAGFILAVINAIIRPIVVILSLPAILFTLGLFMIVVNGLMVLLASKLYSGLAVTNLWAAMLAGMIIGLVNWLVTTILEES
jgi:putative membrane protein